MKQSLKVAHKASQTILILVEAMERGKLNLEQQYPNGLQDIANQLIDPILNKLYVPEDGNLRLNAINLDQDTEAEEQYMLMRDTLHYLLTIISHR